MLRGIGYICHVMDTGWYMVDYIWLRWVLSGICVIWQIPHVCGGYRVVCIRYHLFLVDTLLWITAVFCGYPSYHLVLGRYHVLRWWIQKQQYHTAQTSNIIS